VTIVEFLHPLRSASQLNAILAVMYYLKRYEGTPEVTAAQVSAALSRARHPRARNVQVPARLSGGGPYVHSTGSDGRHVLWALTDTGDQKVRELLNLPADQPEIEHDVTTLTALATRIADDATRGWVEEAILCLRVGALRAATVFLWTGAVVTLRDAVWPQGASAIDAALKRHNPKASFKKKDDFSYVKDADLLEVCQDFQIVDKTEKGRLKEALDLRNACGHPSKYTPGVKKVSAFIEDVVGIVW
jgi:hypothetical protein